MKDSQILLATNGKAGNMQTMEKLLEHIRAKRGRLRDLSAALEVSPSTILTWREVPPHHCISVEKFTGISRYDLRPDVFGEPDATVAGAAE